jgi:outer membrane protein, multidrug efflux system
MFIAPKITPPPRETHGVRYRRILQKYKNRRRRRVLVFHGFHVGSRTVRPRSILAIAIGFACSSCALQAEKPAAPVVPPAFAQAATSNAPWPDATWYHGFASQELDSLVALAQDNSLDVVAATARVKQADARARQAGAALLPQIDLNPNAQQFSGGTHGTTAHELDWSAGLSASYEVDFWGKNRAASNSAKALADASRADLATVRITLSNAVATSYFEVLSLRERIALARLNLEAARGVLQFTEARFNAGSMGAAELAAQRAAVATTELIIPQLQQQEAEALGALALLVGRAPEGFTVVGDRLDALAEPPLAAGLPSELLQRRPDLISAEYGLQAAHGDLLVARAAMYPSLSLTATAGVANPAVNAAITALAGTGWSLTAGASLVQTIFDAGRRRAVIQEAAAKQEELVANYQSSILSALLDVEKALAAIHYLDQQKEPQQRNVDQSERAYQGTQLRFREGTGEYLAVLESQRALFAAREQLSQYKLARLQALLGLCKALGGGWQYPTPPQKQS